MTSGPRVSVVTPVYNGEAHLRQCIESVRAQTYTNWDYTIVNNRSTDRTLEIAREFAAGDPRIFVHDNETFAPVVANHNIALRLISPESKYCKVVFADDWIYPECLEKMVRLAEDNPKVVIVGAYALQGDRLARVVYDDVIPEQKTVVKGRDACRWRLLGGKYIFGAPTAVLMRSDVVRSRQPFYDEANLHADSAINFELLEHADFGFVHQVLTFRREREQSLTSYSIDFNTYIACRLYELIRYGPRYLSEAEQRRRLQELLDSYYWYLATQVYERRGEEFWSFHESKFAEVGLQLSRLRLGRAFAAYTLDLLLNPKVTFKRLSGRIRRTYFEGPEPHPS
jgi:glycosyltransferase involved in cell wall biosynthesis